ncbi:hypothetical protein [Roseovarius sp. Pro17]|uniref:hypothetical protein n=1 Tax=Roseovarius sp. Pro17 TaxID=3108175 RepID=UPI002D77F2BA|nr:hypothetical protein [Roseovarius sp. Pro17]
MKVLKLIAFAFAAVLALGAPQLKAQQALVRSGEHNGYTRVVVDLPRRMPWKSTGSGKSREIIFGSGKLLIDVSQAFDRISGDRLASIDALENGSGVRLGMNCNCDLDIFWHGSSMLVIDVRDSHNESPDAETMLDAATDKADSRARRTTVLESLGGLVSYGSQDSAVALISAYLDSNPSLGGTTVMQDQKIDQARRSIAESISRAATLGLIEADVRIHTRRKDYEAAKKTGSLTASRASGAAKQMQVNLDTRTGANPEFLKEKSPHLQNILGRPCVADELMDVGAWGTTATFAEQVGPARRALTEEFDRYRADAALDMARLYAFFGFGVEAIQILETTNAESDAGDVVLTMAQLIDFERTDSPIFAQQMDCDSDAALWSTLAVGQIGPDRLPNIDAILRALVRYPDHLRELLGARLARILSGGNHGAAAARILRLLDRHVGPQTPPHALARAETEMSLGRAQSADMQLKAVVESNSDSSATALIDRINTRLWVGDPVSAEMVDLVGGYAQEQRDTAIGPDLARAYIGALAAAGLYDSAFDEMKARVDEEDRESFERTADIVASYTVKNAGDLVFLKHFMLPNASTSSGISNPIANKISERLASLGFYKEALTYISGAVDGEALQERRILRAKINLAQSLPRAAMVNVLGLSGPDADGLRADAYSQLGEHRSAHALYISLGKTDDALREALLAEEWGDAKDFAGPVLNEVIGDMSFERNADSTATLARNRILLEQSAGARENISRMLEATDRTIDPG